MALNLDKELKTYFSIKEVSEIIGVSEPTLRYWEQEFSHIRPKTTANRVRQYTQKNIDDIKVIYNMIKVRGFKIAAARKMLQANRGNVEANAKVMDNLINIKAQLQELKDSLNMLV